MIPDIFMVRNNGLHEHKTVGLLVVDNLAVAESVSCVHRQ